MIVKRFLRCIELRTGSLIIGIVSLIASLLAGAGSITWGIMASEPNREAYSFGVSLPTSVASSIAAGLLIYGSIKELQSYVLISLTTFGVATIIGIILMITVVSNTWAFLAITVLVPWMYFYICVVSYYQQLVEKETYTRGCGCENIRLDNNIACIEMTNYKN